MGNSNAAGTQQPIQLALDATWQLELPQAANLNLHACNNTAATDHSNTQAKDVDSDHFLFSNSAPSPQV